MVSNLKERGIDLKGLFGAPTLHALTQRCISSGFSSVRAATMRQLYLSVPRDVQLRLNKIEMIDDWDEWNLVHDHYAFVIAWTGGGGDAESIPPPFPS
jgi:[phosphatase 2A protein]-leucine-carboxy methyltransferase